MDTKCNINITDNFKTPGSHWGTACLAIVLWKPSFFSIVTTLPSDGTHQLEIETTFTPEAGQTLTNQVCVIHYLL